MTQCQIDSLCLYACYSTLLPKFKETEMGSPVDFFIGLGKSLFLSSIISRQNLYYTAEHYVFREKLFLA